MNMYGNDVKKQTTLKADSKLGKAFKVLSQDNFVNIKDFPDNIQKVLWPAYNQGFLIIYKNGLVRLNAAGKKLYAKAK